MNRMFDMDTAASLWSEKEKLPPVSAKYQIVTAIACFLSALALPLCTSEECSLVALALLFVYVAIFVRRPATVTLTLVSTFAVFMMTQMFGVGSFFLALIVGTMSCTFLLTVWRHWWTAALLPIAATGIACFLVEDPRQALLALLFLPAALLLSHATLRGKHRTSAVCFASGGLLLSLAVLLLFLIREYVGSFELSQIREAVTSLRDSMANDLIAARNELLASDLVTGNAQMKEFYEATMKTYSDTYLRSLVELLFNLFPAIAVIACNILAYEAHTLLNAGYAAAGRAMVVTVPVRALTMSLSAAILYALSFLLIVLLPADTLVLAAVENLCLILLPGLCVVGGGLLMAMIGFSKGKGKSLWLILFVLLLCLNFSSALYILAMFGAYAIVAAAIRKKLKHKKDPDDHNNDK